jgi:hypothetical protein
MGFQEENGRSPLEQVTSPEVIRENGSANHADHDDRVEDKASLEKGPGSPMNDRDREVGLVLCLG